MSCELAAVAATQRHRDFRSAPCYCIADLDDLWWMSRPNYRGKIATLQRLERETAAPDEHSFGRVVQTTAAPKSRLTTQYSSTMSISSRVSQAMIRNAQRDHREGHSADTIAQPPPATFTSRRTPHSVKTTTDRCQPEKSTMADSHRKTR